MYFFTTKGNYMDTNQNIAELQNKLKIATKKRSAHNRPVPVNSSNLTHPISPNFKNDLEEEKKTMEVLLTALKKTT